MATHSSILVSGLENSMAYIVHGVTKSRTRLHDFHQLPRWYSGKEAACQCSSHKRCQFGPRSGRSPGIGNGNSL